MSADTKLRCNTYEEWSLKKAHTENMKRLFPKREAIFYLMKLPPQCTFLNYDRLTQKKGPPYLCRTTLNTNKRAATPFESFLFIKFMYFDHSLVYEVVLIWDQSSLIPWYVVYWPGAKPWVSRFVLIWIYYAQKDNTLIKKHARGAGANPRLTFIRVNDKNKKHPSKMTQKVKTRHVHYSSWLVKFWERGAEHNLFQCFQIVLISLRGRGPRSHARVRSPLKNDKKGLSSFPRMLYRRTCLGFTESPNKSWH